MNRTARSGVVVVVGAEPGGVRFHISCAVEAKKAAWTGRQGDGLCEAKPDYGKNDRS